MKITDKNILSAKGTNEIYGTFAEYIIEKKRKIYTLHGEYIIPDEDKVLVCLKCLEYENITVTYGTKLIIECVCGNKTVMK